jgi:hypothetical protein
MSLILTGSISQEYLSLSSLCVTGQPYGGESGDQADSPRGHKHGIFSFIIVEGLHYDIKYINTLADQRISEIYNG